MINKNSISDQDDDLKGAPHLSNLNANNPFKSDADYFENFASKLQDQINDFEEIKSEAPVLSAIPKYNPFEVPHNYFDELSVNIQQKIINNRSTLSYREWIIQLIRPRFAIPVLATILIAVSGINFMNKHAETQKAEMSDQTSIEEELYSIDESTIIETLDPVAGTENGNILVEDNSIENYLIENNVDETFLTKM